VDSGAGLGAVENLLPLPAIELRFFDRPTSSLVTILTQLSGTYKGKDLKVSLVLLNITP
jgi:hypothetical protein